MSNKFFITIAIFLAIVQVAVALGTKNPPSDNWEPPAGDDQSGSGVTYISTKNPNCGADNTQYQCYQINQDASVTNPQNLTITCDTNDLCSLPFDFSKDGNIAAFSVNCLSSVGKPIGSGVNIELYGKRNYAPVGTVYGSYKLKGDKVKALWKGTATKQTKKTKRKSKEYQGVFYTTQPATELIIECPALD